MSTTAASRGGPVTLASGADMLERTRQVFHLLPAPREAGVGHEVLVRRKGLRRIPTGNAAVSALGVHCPALRLVVDVGDHDLGQNLLVGGRVLDGYERFHPAVEV